MDISIIIPAYNEHNRIKETLDATIRFCRKFFTSYEIIVVDDGSTDDTADIARTFARKGVRLLTSKKNMGKGYSVRLGLAAGKAPWLLFMDSDLATPLQEIEHFWKRRQEADMLIASRNLPASQKLVKQPFLRNLAGQIFPVFVRLALLPAIHDSQCGFKMVSKKSTRDILSHLSVDGWAFDVELLFAAKQRGFRILELPVSWIDQPGSKIRFLRDAPLMLWDVLLIRWRWLCGQYR